VFLQHNVILKSAGSHTVRVHAWNHISNTSGTVDIIIREYPPEIKVIPLLASSTSTVALAVQTVDGAFLYREDLIFSFAFPGEPPHLTQVPVVTRELHQDNPSHISEPAPSMSSPPSSSSYFPSEIAVASTTTKSVSETSNWQLVEGSDDIAKTPRSRPLSRARGIGEEIKGRGRRYRRHGEITERGRGKQKEDADGRGESKNLDLELSRPNQLSAGGYDETSAQGGRGSAGRKRPWSLPAPQASGSPPTPGARTGAAKVPGSPEKSARLASGSEQASAAEHVSLANE
ncbi:hypothetical protein EGW08_009762, partial [Elysia chlorotica]